MRMAGFAGAALAAAIATAAVVLVLGSSESPDSRPALSPAALEDTRQRARSHYLALGDDREVHAPTTLLQTRLTLGRRDSVFVQSDGTYAPLGAGAAGNVFIEINGRRVSNDSVIDWRGSHPPVRHSFNVIGVAELPEGIHDVELVAVPIAGALTVSRTSNLSILVHPARRVGLGRMARKAGAFDFVTSNRGGRGDRLPHTTLTSVVADARSPTVALAAASARRVGRNGDAMLGIYVDRRHPGNGSSLWTVNDMCVCAETQAPLYTHALLRGGTRRSVISLEATEYPWDQPGAPVHGEDNANYVVRPGATLVTLGGDMHVLGKAEPDLPGAAELADTAWDWSCAGKEGSTPSQCPDTGTDVRIASETFEVPERHPGVVMFAAKTRVQADRLDTGGATRLWLTVDGKRVGSVGVQELTAPSTISQRTISASYLSAGEQRLRPGKHTIAVYARVEGSFASVAVSRDLPLVWFD